MTTESDANTDQTQSAARSPDGPTLAVRAVLVDVRSGPDAGRQATIDRPTFVIGSGDSTDLRLTDSTVSREHLRLSLTPEGVHVRDEGSKNGTWLGETRIADIVLTNDTSLRIGTTVLALRVEKLALELPLSENARFGNAIGVSASMRHLFGILERAAQSEVTVLLEGESGVGKDVLACGLHEHSARKDGPFVVVDCGALPAGLIESELFGYERGAFTGATHPRKGAFELAHGGTIMLDEVGELPLDLQPKLLRVLENREIRPLGSSEVRSVDVRVIAATNRRLAESAARAEFRRDLYYRLAVVRVTVPPLRDRPDDIVPIARELLRKISGNPDAELPEDFGAMLASFSWPGNVRELRNALERYAHLGLRDDPRGEPARLATGLEDLGKLPYHEARRTAVDRFERTYAPQVLERAGGVVVRAAEAAEMGRASFYRLLHRAGLIKRDSSDAMQVETVRARARDDTRRRNPVR